MPDASYDDVADGGVIWLPPEMILTVRTADGEIIAYGIKGDLELEDDDDGS